jgi:general secretion pathway protein A
MATSPKDVPTPALPPDRGSGPSSAGPEHKGFYADFFGFRERPFTLLPDPELLLWSTQYRRAFSVLEFGVLSRSPITLLTGAIGCGKTTLLRELLSQLDDSLTVGLISNAQGGRGALIQWVLNALRVRFDHDAGYVHLFQAMQDFMIAEFAAGRRTLLIFDEAQNLSQESLEELRMVTNINTGKDEVVQLVLIGQPELRDMIRSPRLEQLAQRIAVSFHLEALDAETTSAFILHRLRAVGGTGAEFTAEACAFVHEVTRGVPRLINQFCDMALLYAWTRESPQVTRGILAQVLADNIFFAAQVSSPPFESRHDTRRATASKDPDQDPDQRDMP